MTATNSFLPPKVFANAALKVLKNSLVMAKLVDNEGLDQTFQPGVGGTVYVKRPPEFYIRTGAVASPQNTVEGQIPVTIDQQVGVDAQFTSQEEVLNVSALLKSRVMKSAMITIASQIDQTLMARTAEFPLTVGTWGNVSSSPTALLAYAQKMDEFAMPMSDRVGLLNPADYYGVAGSLLGNAAQAGGVAKTALEKAKLPIISDIDWYMTQTIPSLATTARTGTGVTVNGANQNVAYTVAAAGTAQTLVLAGAGNAMTYKAGEVFTIAGVYAVNPRTKANLGYLRQFTVLTDGLSDGSGNVTLTIAPHIISTTGSDGNQAYQNVSAAPASGAALVFAAAASTTYRPNVAFHKTAIKLVSVKMPRPFTGESDYSTDPETGLTIRYWRYSDGTNDLHNHRFDVFYGTATTDRRLGVRGFGA